MSDTVVIGSTKPNPVQLPVPGSLLTKWNGAMALFHGALTAVTLAVGNLDLRVPVYASEISLDVGDSNSTSEWRLVPGVATRSGWMYLTYLTASFFFLSCVFHTGNVLLWRAPYQRALAGGFAPFRWAEYSLSASVMVLILSYTSGTIELYLLVLLFGLTFVTMLFGHLHEVICRPESLDLWEGRPLYRLQAHFFGYVPQLFAWGIILAQFFKAGGASTTDAAGGGRRRELCHPRSPEITRDRPRLGNERQMPAFVCGAPRCRTHIAASHSQHTRGQVIGAAGARGSFPRNCIHGSRS
mmetsp:Transcript_36540/g.117821  ORF Transcript_36540/g.117821 Transcript_36540/m.117821 type:complete len:298 (-) Transcript_36540:534-1427(-)